MEENISISAQELADAFNLILQIKDEIIPNYVGPDGKPSKFSKTEENVLIAAALLSNAKDAPKKGHFAEIAMTVDEYISFCLVISNIMEGFDKMVALAGTWRILKTEGIKAYREGGKMYEELKKERK